MLPRAPRSDWVDFVKGTAIFLVVLGHSSGLPPGLRSLIYSFHVPAFLLITGYLLPRDVAGQGAGAFARRHLMPFVRAYLLFSLLSIAVMLAGFIARGQAGAAPILPAFAGMLYGVEGPFDGLVHNNAPLWYFPFLISSLLALWCAAQLPRPLAGVVMLAAATAGFALTGYWWPWYLQFAGIGGLFLWIGWTFRPAFDRLSAALATRPAGRLMLALALAALLIALQPEGMRYNLNQGSFGAHGWAFVLTALCGTLALALWGQILPATRAMRLLSDHTLVIFCCHIYLIHLTRRIPYDLPWDVPRVVVLVAAAAGTCAACLALSRGGRIWPGRYLVEPGRGAGDRVRIRSRGDAARSDHHMFGA